MCSPTTCPLASKCVPKMTPPHDPRTHAVCVCDPDSERLDALMAEGIDQRTASLMLWAPDQLQHRAAS